MRSMDLREFAHWEAYFAMDPFGLQREDARFAMLAMVMAKLAGAKDVKLEQFMLYPQRSVWRQTKDAMVANAKLLVGWFRGNHNRQS